MLYFFHVPNSGDSPAPVQVPEPKQVIRAITEAVSVVQNAGNSSLAQ
jgi:hypothetical protein